MHSYDADRHVWRYDLGGMAWDNTELGADMWLWVSFLRSGRADLFRLAEAMTRHTSEVDCYHLGALAGLGSRHNVRHWGCGAKEARISQAGPVATRPVEGPWVLNPGEEAARIGTNGAAQSSLSAIEILEMCADQLPTAVPPPQEFPGGRGGRGGQGGARGGTLSSSGAPPPAGGTLPK